MDLVILAGGLGSRFGGLKQIEPIDEEGNFIIDYSVYDAIKAGFDRVIFVIKEEILEEFEETIGKRLKDKIQIEYAFQKMDSFVPKEKQYNYKGRLKPWGTAHAVLSAKDKIKDDFVMLNADDFYGKNSFKQLYNFLKNNKDKSNFGMVAYNVSNTLSQNGEVKRGICKVEDNNLVDLEESIIKQENNNIYAKPIYSKDDFKKIDNDTLVSMNLFGFTTKIFDFLEDEFCKFLENNKDDLSSCEFFIPLVLSNFIKDNKAKVTVLKTTERWFGLTYKEDYDIVNKGIKEQKTKGKYPSSLWG